MKLDVNEKQPQKFQRPLHGAVTIVGHNSDILIKGSIAGEAYILCVCQTELQICLSSLFLMTSKHRWGEEWGRKNRGRWSDRKGCFKVGLGKRSFSCWLRNVPMCNSHITNCIMRQSGPTITYYQNLLPARHKKENSWFCILNKFWQVMEKVKKKKD